MTSKSANAKAQRAPARNGSESIRATYPIIAIDPGTPLAVAIFTPGRAPSWHLLSKGASWETALDPHLPAHVFIEAPTGDDGFLRDQVGRIVQSIARELSPFDRDRQLIPVSVWRLEVLGHGGAAKDDAVKWASKRYQKTYGALVDDGRLFSHDLAEALCIMEYGRRVVTGRLQHGLPGVTQPRYELAPPTRRSRFKGKYPLAQDNGRPWPDAPPEPPWHLIRKHGGETLAGIVRVWASCYEAVTVHCAERPWRFSERSIAADARVRPESVPEYLKALVDAKLVYKEKDYYIFQPVTEGTIYIRPSGEPPKGVAFGRLFAPFMHYRNDYETRSAWVRCGDPALPPSHWARKEKRKRHDARWGKQPCMVCGTYSLSGDAEYCDLCEQGNERYEAKQERQAVADAAKQKAKAAGREAEAWRYDADKKEREAQRQRDLYKQDRVTPDAVEEAERVAAQYQESADLFEGEAADLARAADEARTAVEVEL